ncbi:hypothetical protein D3C72_1275600 [compost metagenome]
MMAGFVHGVLNTDNMNITGESFDYGPYRFLPHYDPSFTAAYFDNSGLYAYGRQPASVMWNLHQLGAALMVAYPNLSVEELLEDFPDNFTLKVHQYLLKRLNLRNPLEDEAAAGKLNEELVMALFQFMSASKSPFEQTLFDLHSGVNEGRLKRSPQSQFYQGELFEKLKSDIDAFEILDEAKQAHPYFAQPKACSLLIDELESIWAPIAAQDDWTLFETKLQEIRSIRNLY